LTRELLRPFSKPKAGKNSKYCWKEKSYSNPDIRMGARGAFLITLREILRRGKERGKFRLAAVMQMVVCLDRY
jgi:hypothetical protein